MPGAAFPIADLVVMAIEDKSDYSNLMSPTVARRMAPNVGIKNREDVEAAGLTVDVTPVGLVAELRDQDLTIETYEIRITVRDAVPHSDNSDDVDESELKKRLTFVSEMITQIYEYADDQSNELLTIEPYTVTPLYDSEELAGGVFTSIPTIRFRHSKIAS